MTPWTTKKVSWLGMLALGAGLGLSSPAEACSAPLCEAGAMAPLPTSGAVPANVPALVLLPSEMGGSIDTRQQPPQLLRSDDSLVATRSVEPGMGESGWLVVPESPLVPGETYRLRAQGVCPAPQGSTRSLEASFTAGAASPLPTATGSLRVDASGHERLSVAHGSLCSNTIDAGSVRFGFTPAPELVPFLPWVHWTLEVDGQRWTAARHGSVRPDGTLVPPNNNERIFGARRLLQVHTSCGGSHDETHDKGLSPGRHRATLRPALANAPGSLPPVEVDFELPTCPTTPPPEPEPRPGWTGFGCSHAGGAGVPALLGLFSLGFLARRRTRRVPSRSRS
jgi:MYXO-CTERM domain-containing protein